MDGEQAPNRLIINLGKLRDFLTKCLLCVAAAWNLCFRCCQESGEDEPSENYNKDKFSQECGEYLDRFCHWRTLRERRFKFLQLIYRFFHRRNSEEENENENKRESETENNQPVQNETGVIHDMGLRLRIRKGEQASESRPSTGVMVDHSGCDAEADGLSQGSNTPAASTTDAAVTPPSNSSSVPPLLDDDDDDADGERAILGTSVMPSPKTRPTETTSPLTPINKSATSALAVLDQNNSPSQLIKPPASQPTSDSCSSFSPTMHVPTSNTSPHLDSPVHSTASVATECEGEHRKDPPSQTTEPRDNSGPSALVLHSEDKKTSDTQPPLPPTGLMEEAGAEGIVASDTSHSCSNPETSDTYLKSDDAVEKEYPKQGPTAAWKDNPVSGRTFTHMPPVVAAQAEVQILKTKPGGPDRLGKAASSRLQTPVSDRSSPEGLTPWTNEARETDKDVHNPNSSSSNGPHDTSTQPPLACAESDLTSSAASEEASRQVDLSSELSEEDDVHSKPESLPSDKVD